MTMVVDAEFEDITVTEDQLDLTADESLPWLESDEDDPSAGGIDGVQVMSFLAVLLAVAAAIIIAVWFFTKGSGDAEIVADGSTIEAPAGPIKERPEDPGGKEFEGTGNLAPGVGEGEVRDGQMADGDGSEGAGDDAPRPSVDTQTTQAGSPGVSAGSGEGSSAASSNTSGVAVQLAAYGNRARAEKGWSDLSRSSDALNGVRYRIVEAKVDIGTVYRLQAMASNRAEADRLCAALKADGLECAVKP